MARLLRKTFSMLRNLTMIENAEKLQAFCYLCFKDTLQQTL